MNPTINKLKGILLSIIGSSALIYGIHYLLETYQTNLEMSSDRLIFLIPAFVLSGITYYFTIKFLKFKPQHH